MAKNRRRGLIVAIVVIVVIAAGIIGYLLLRPDSRASQAYYVRTPWGTRCQVTADEIICDTCEPGLLLDTPAGTQCPTPGLNEVVVTAAGASKSPAAGVILAESPGIQQLSGGQTHHINGWTITVSNWVRFTNEATRHGMAVAAQNYDFF
ncbi:MAG: hypothetical protein ACRDTV_17050 [Mycobacterium sp.]